MSFVLTPRRLSYPLLSPPAPPSLPCSLPCSRKTPVTDDQARVSLAPRSSVFFALSPSRSSAQNLESSTTARTTCTLALIVAGEKGEREGRPRGRPHAPLPTVCSYSRGHAQFWRGCLESLWASSGQLLDPLADSSLERSRP